MPSFVVKATITYRHAGLGMPIFCEKFIERLP